VQLAKNAGAYVIAVTSARTGDQAEAAGADEVTGTVVTDPVDVVLNLAPIQPDQLTALLDVIRPGGVLVNTTVWMPAPSDEQRGVRGIDLFVRSDAAQLSHLAGLVDSGELRVTVAQRVPLAELPAVHADAAAGTLPGKTVIVA
jgi:NADPH:quinone reductase-like Zn-dependent oxidoreductase